MKSIYLKSIYWEVFEWFMMGRLNKFKIRLFKFFDILWILVLHITKMIGFVVEYWLEFDKLLGDLLIILSRFNFTISDIYWWKIGWFSL
jgi:hypothetical protein